MMYFRRSSHATQRVEHIIQLRISQWTSTLAFALLTCIVQESRKQLTTPSRRRRPQQLCSRTTFRLSIGTSLGLFRHTSKSYGKVRVVSTQLSIFKFQSGLCFGLIIIKTLNSHWTRVCHVSYCISMFQVNGQSQRTDKVKGHGQMNVVSSQIYVHTQIEYTIVLVWDANNQGLLGLFYFKIPSKWLFSIQCQMPIIITLSDVLCQCCPFTSRLDQVP